LTAQLHEVPLLGEADERMSIGLVTCDGSIPNAYFYATACPAPALWMDLKLPEGAYCRAQRGTGGVLPDSSLTASSKPPELLPDYLHNVQAEGAKLRT
jgi:hypothetical protein